MNSSTAIRLNSSAVGGGGWLVNDECFSFSCGSRKTTTLMMSEGVEERKMEQKRLSTERFSLSPPNDLFLNSVVYPVTGILMGSGRDGDFEDGLVWCSASSICE